MRLTLRYSLLLVVTALASLLLFPAYFNGPYPHYAGPTFDNTISQLYRHDIERLRPEVVLLGDSMLTKGVDRSEFEGMSGAPTYKLDIPGSGSTLWYLVFKSNILTAQPPPRTVVILFRDAMLTAPAFRTTGPYFGLVDKFASPQDTLLIERAYLSQLQPWQVGLEGYLPLYTYHAEIRESVDGLLRHTLPRALGCNAACADDAMTDVLGDIQPALLERSIRQAEAGIYTPGQLDFEAVLRGSFLPEMVRLARQNGIRLIFVRAPTNLFPDPTSEPEGLAEYMADLRDYLRTKKIPLLDLSRTEEITAEHFVDPHHLGLEGKTIFTRLIAQAVREKLK